MKTKHIVIISTMAVTGMVMIGAGAVTMRPSLAGNAVGTMAKHAGFSGWHGGRHGGRHARGMAMVCGDYRDQKLEAAVGFVEGFVGFDANQQAAWKELSAALRDASKSVGGACDRILPADGDATAPQKLAKVQLVIETGLATVKRVRPAFDALYATLNDKQKKALDGLMSHRHHGG